MQLKISFEKKYKVILTSPESFLRHCYYIELSFASTEIRAEKRDKTKNVKNNRKSRKIYVQNHLFKTNFVTCQVAYPIQHQFLINLTIIEC